MDTLLGAPGRAGVAANQIGVGARVFVYDADGHRGHVVNPTLEVSEELQDGDEGCLSIPELYFPTPRAMHATVRGFDEHGEPIVVCRDRASWRGRCSTRPTTSTASCTSTPCAATPAGRRCARSARRPGPRLSHPAARSAGGGAEPRGQPAEQILLLVTDPRHVAVRP